MSYYPQYFAVIFHNTEHNGFGYTLPHEESHNYPQLGNHWSSSDEEHLPPSGPCSVCNLWHPLRFWTHRCAFPAASARPDWAPRKKRQFFPRRHWNRTHCLVQTQSRKFFFLFVTEQTFVKSNSEKDGKFLAIKINKFKIVQNFACISTCNAHFSACNANFSICDARFSTCNAQAVVVCCRFASGFRERSRSSRAQQRHRAAARSPGAPRRCNASGSRSGAPGVNNSLNRFSRNNNRRTTGALISKGGTL